MDVAVCSAPGRHAGFHRCRCYCCSHEDKYALARLPFKPVLLALCFLMSEQGNLAACLILRSWPEAPSKQTNYA